MISHTCYARIFSDYTFAVMQLKQGEVMLYSFEQVRGTTKCPFAKKAKVIEVSLEEATIGSICEALSNILPMLTQHTLDAALISLPEEFTKKPEDIGYALFHILISLDKTCLAGVESRDWKLYLQNEKFFVATFWYGFEESSPRKCPEGAFLLFQPKSSFERGGLRGDTERKIRLSIRKMFAIGGKPYNHEPLSEAERFLPEVKWWIEQI